MICINNLWLFATRRTKKFVNWKIRTMILIKNLKINLSTYFTGFEKKSRLNSKRRTSKSCEIYWNQRRAWKSFRVGKRATRRSIHNRRARSSKWKMRSSSWRSSSSSTNSWLGAWQEQWTREEPLKRKMESIKLTLPIRAPPASSTTSATWTTKSIPRASRPRTWAKKAKRFWIEPAYPKASKQGLRYRHSVLVEAANRASKMIRGWCKRAHPKWIRREVWT